MRSARLLAAAGWLFVGLALPAGGAFGTEQAGVSAAVKGQVALSRPQVGVGRQVVSGEAIHLQDAIRSGAQSGMQILLLDETVFTIGPESELVVDEFVYDPQTNAGKVSAQITKGVFRFVTGKVAKQNPADMNVRLPSGTLGVRGTMVAGRVDEASGGSLLVLLGEGQENDTGSPAGAFEACNAGVCRQVRRPGYGVNIEGPASPPSDPYRVPQQELDRLTQAVSDPAGWTQTAGKSDGETPDVAAGADGGGVEDGDGRSATEVSGRQDAAGGEAAQGLERRLGAQDRLDEVTTGAQQDETEETVLASVAEGGLLPGPDLPSPPSDYPSDLPSLPGFSGLDPGSITTFQDLSILAGSGVGADYYRSGISLDDGGSYSFYFDVDFGQRSANISVSRLNSPSLGLENAGFYGVSALDDSGTDVPFAFIGATLSQGETRCDSGCAAYAAALLLNGPNRLAEQAFHLIEIVPPPTPSDPDPSSVMTTLTMENMTVPLD